MHLKQLVCNSTFLKLFPLFFAFTSQTPCGLQFHTLPEYFSLSLTPSAIPPTFFSPPRFRFPRWVSFPKDFLDLVPSFQKYFGAGTPLQSTRLDSIRPLLQGAAAKCLGQSRGTCSPLGESLHSSRIRERKGEERTGSGERGETGRQG